jgi:hypothetical protein
VSFEVLFFGKVGSTITALNDVLGALVDVLLVVMDLHLLSTASTSPHSIRYGILLN